MEDEASSSLDGKELGNLRVVDLKQELEKRGLSKSGSKKDLVKRLKQQLEFEKLCEERKSGDLVPKIELDAEIQQNEFVQQYLAQQQKRYAEREEKKRLEMKALQQQEEKPLEGNENQVISDPQSVSDSEETCDKKEIMQIIPSENKPLEENQAIVITGKKNENYSSTSESENEASNPPTVVTVSGNVIHDNSESCNKTSGENTAQTFIDSASSHEKISQISSPLSSHSDSPKNEESPLHSEHNSEHSESNQHVSVIQEPQISKPDCKLEKCPSEIKSSAIVADATKIEKDSEISSNGNSSLVAIEHIEHKSGISSTSKVEESKPTPPEDVLEKCPSESKSSALVTDALKEKKDNEISSNVTSLVTVEHTEYKSDISSTSKVKNSKPTSPEASAERIASPEDLTKHQSPENMETSECSSVPYSLSDIQLPESPGSRLKCKDVKSDDKSSVEQSSEPIDDQKSPVNKNTQSNGDVAADAPNPPQEEVMSESETKESSYSNDSPVKPNLRKDSREYRQSDESSDSKSDKNNSQYRKKSDESSDSKSDRNNSQYKKKSDESSDSESDKNDSQYRKKSFNSEDTSSNVAADSDEDSSRQNINSEQKSSKPHKQTDESDNEKSTDSEKYRHRQADSKRKSARDKQKTRKRRSRSRSSSTSSSSSSDRSPKRRSSKKSVVTRKKNFSENEESKHVSSKSSDEEAEKLKKNDGATESSNKSVSITSTTKRLKIKRDNVPIEKTSVHVESPGNASSSKSVEKSSSTMLSEHNNLPKSEPSEVKKSIPEVTYTPRKVILSNRKLNRNTSEDKSNEPKTKKSKWESFAAVQKTSNTISISTDSLKNWFPDFKLMSEASSSMEIETDEHEQPVSAMDDKNIVGYSDVSNTNDSVMKQEPISQMDIEDSESQEPNYEEAQEKGPVSKIIFIQNLVRPFTLNQLKDLLKQNGNIIEEYFWIDKIKSKCFVMYESEKEAIKAKNALNNTRWPSSNPKILSVEFSSEEELEQHKKGNELPPPKPVLEPPVVEPVEVVETRVPHSVDEHKRKERERRRDRDRSKPQAPVREWDKDKVMQESPEREHIVKEEKPRSSDKKEKKESKKRPNEDTPAKLLDDLFQKTKSPPCIYWLPLTEEQAKQKEEAKKQRKLEREKRNQQLRDQEAERRNRRDRSSRDRSSRRSREKENRKSSTRSRSPVTRRR